MQSGGILDADSHGKPAPSHARALFFRRWGLARRASRNNLPGEASATAMANPRRRSRMLRYFGAGGWPVGLPETSFRQASGRNCRFINQKRTNGQISSFGLRMADFILSRVRSLSAARIKFYQQWPLYQGRGPGSEAAMAVLSSRSGQIARSPRFGLRIRFHIAPYKEFISGQAEPFLSRAGKAICRFIKAGQPQWAFYQRRWPFYQGRPASIAVLATVAALSRPGTPVYHQEAAAWPDLDKACGWPISYCLVQAVYQRPSRAIFRKSWQSDRTASKASKASYKASYAASYFLKLLRKLLFKRLTASSKAPCKAPYKAFYSFL